MLWQKEWCEGKAKQSACNHNNTHKKYLGCSEFHESQCSPHSQFQSVKDEDKCHFFARTTICCIKKWISWRQGHSDISAENCCHAKYCLQVFSRHHYLHGKRAEEGTAPCGWGCENLWRWPHSVITADNFCQAKHCLEIFSGHHHLTV